jgi:hypothetical protein
MMGEGQKSARRSVLTAMAAALLVALFSESAMAQCVMCRASIGSNSAFARHLNIGTLVLLVPPVLIFCTIFVMAFRHRRSL